jgi:iron-regulated transporter 1
VCISLLLHVFDFLQKKFPYFRLDLNLYGWACFRCIVGARACFLKSGLSICFSFTGYAYAQGLSESTIGIVAALDSGAGFLGTFGFQFLRSRVGLVRTGIISLGWQVSCLSLCVASVWAPGSPFLHLFNIGTASAIQNCSVTGQQLSNQSYHSNLTGLNFTVATTTAVSDGFDDQRTFSNWTRLFSNETCRNVTDDGPRSMAHMGLLMTGIVVSRFGKCYNGNPMITLHPSCSSQFLINPII